VLEIPYVSPTVGGISNDHHDHIVRKGGKRERQRERDRQRERAREEGERAKRELSGGTFSKWYEVHDEMRS
jgi:hypothetical protein